MPARKISEQQFRTRRKDRKMVWVDLTAFMVGLLVLAVSVGGVIVIDPEPQPFEADYSFAEGKITQKACVEFAGVAEGCTIVLPERKHFEGETLGTVFQEVTAPNVTTVNVQLTWIDDTPITQRPDCEQDQNHREHCDKTFIYDENSTDTLMVEVTSPTGEVQSGIATNDVETKAGRIVLTFNVTPLPESGELQAFTLQEAQRQLMDQHTVTEHAALGEWRATVTVVRAGDQNGTLPTSACTDVPPAVIGGLPPDVAENCNLHEEQDEVEQAASSTPPPGTVYQASYEDTSQRWILEFSVRTYQSVIG